MEFASYQKTNKANQVGGFKEKEERMVWLWQYCPYLIRIKRNGKIYLIDF
jgi:hypothetical protein